MVVIGLHGPARSSVRPLDSTGSLAYEKSGRRDGEKGEEEEEEEEERAQGIVVVVVMGVWPNTGLCPTNGFASARKRAGSEVEGLKKKKKKGLEG